MVTRGERDAQPGGFLFPIQFSVGTEKLNLLDLSGTGGCCGPERLNDNWLLRPAEDQGIDHRIGLVARKADVLLAQLGDAVTLKRASFYGVRPFAINLPRPGLVNGLAIGLDPGREAVEKGQLFRIKRPIRPARNIQNKGAVFAHRINEPVDNIARMRVPAELTGLLKQRTVVVPLS